MRAHRDNRVPAQFAAVHRLLEQRHDPQLERRPYCQWLVGILVGQHLAVAADQIRHLARQFDRSRRPHRRWSRLLLSGGCSSSAVTLPSSSRLISTSMLYVCVDDLIDAPFWRRSAPAPRWWCAPGRAGPRSGQAAPASRNASENCSACAGCFSSVSITVSGASVAPGPWRRHQTQRQHRNGDQSSHRLLL